MAGCRDRDEDSWRFIRAVTAHSFEWTDRGIGLSRILEPKRLRRPSEMA